MAKYLKINPQAEKGKRRVSVNDEAQANALSVSVPLAQLMAHVRSLAPADWQGEVSVNLFRPRNGEPSLDFTAWKEPKGASSAGSDTDGQAIGAAIAQALGS